MPSLDLLQGSAPSRLLKPVGNAVWRSFVTCHNTTLMYFPDGQDGNVWWHEGQPAGDIQVNILLWDFYLFLYLW